MEPPLSGPLFKKKMSYQMVNYRARNMHYPGDEKMRGATQTGKRYRGTSDTGVTMVTQENNSMKRVHYDTYVNEKIVKTLFRKHDTAH